ncbi:MAG: hypothetical protein V1736_00800 [Pseudomonadota bacterium]
MLINIADAAPVICDFSGIVTGVSDNLDVLPDAIIMGTSTIAGSFEYDTDAPSEGLWSGEYPYYKMKSFEIIIDNIHQWNALEPDIVVANASRPYDWDGMKIAKYGIYGTFPYVADPNIRCEMDMHFEDSTGTALDSSALPTSISLSDWESVFCDLTAEGTYRIHGEITALEPRTVPVPGAAYMLGSGLLGLIGLRKKLEYK